MEEKEDWKEKEQRQMNLWTWIILAIVSMYGIAGIAHNTYEWYGVPTIILCTVAFVISISRIFKHKR